MLSPGSPVCVARGGELSSELAYGNHPSVASHADVVYDKVCTDIIHGRALFFYSRFAADVLRHRIMPLAHVLEPKYRIIRELTFARPGGRTSVNDDTDFSSAPPCELGHVLRDVVLRAVLAIAAWYYRLDYLVPRRCQGYLSAGSS